MTYGELAYNAYREAIDHKTHSEMPPWEALGGTTHAAWMEVASVIAAAVTRDMANALGGNIPSERP